MGKLRITRLGMYSDSAVDFGQEEIDRIAEQVSGILRPDDVLVGTGLSGSLVVPKLAAGLGCEWAVVRKTSDKAHSSNPMEGTNWTRRWFFVDDFVSTGKTFENVLRGVRKWVERQKDYYGDEVDSELVGVIEYSDYKTASYRSREEILEKYQATTGYGRHRNATMRALIQGHPLPEEIPDLQEVY